MVTAKEATRRYAAFADAMHAQKGQLSATAHSLREDYATGRITLDRFEAEITVLLRRAA